MFHRFGVLLCLGLLVGCWQDQDRVELSDDPEVYMLKAREYIDSAHPTEAIGLLEEYVRRTGNYSGEISELLASACSLNGDEELAVFYLEQAAGLSELKYYCYLKAAEIYEKLNDREQALLSYKCYLEALPEDNEIQIKYANTFLAIGKKKKALEIFVNHAANDFAVHRQIAELFLEFGNYIQARNWYLSALGYEKNNLTALEGLWKISLLLNDWDALRETGSILWDLGVKTIGGISLEALMESLKARQKAWTALNAVEIRFDRAILPMFATEEIPQNLPISENLIPELQELSPDSKTGKNEKIEALKIDIQRAKDRGDYEEAIAILWKILGLEDKNVDAWTNLTHCLLKMNKYDRAEMAIQEAIKLSPDHVDFHLTYLDIVLRTHSSADYVRILKEIKQKFPRDADIRLAWARAKEVYMSDAMGAKHSYEKFLKLASPEHPEISKIEHLLETYQREKNDGESGENRK
ncbi:MAG: tetratricopeptide repeat protein [Puniceicoccales bacterium]|jgi:tetratricopeptide (TPR) repeat protein|nr:tetratricopeptide repeat protein [Puniceicoccales bacterium]